jgi:hypothetical protein
MKATRNSINLSIIALMLLGSLSVAFLNSCGSKSEGESASEEITEPIDASEEIGTLLNNKNYTKSTFSQLIEQDGIHENYDSKWKPDNSNIDEELYDALANEKEVVFTGNWGDISSSFYPNGFDGFVWEYKYFNQNCWSDNNVPHFIEVDLSTPDKYLLKTEEWYNKVSKFSKSIANKKTAIVGKIVEISVAGAESACKNGWLRVHIDGKTAKVYNLETKQRVY